MLKFKALRNIASSIRRLRRVDKDALFQRANQHLDAAENRQAAALYEYLRAHGDQSPLTRGKLLTAYLRTSQQMLVVNPSEARRFLDAAEGLDRDNDNVQIGYIHLLRREGSHDAANQREDAFLKRVNIPIERRMLLANIANNTRQYARAVDLLDQILALEPRHAAAAAMRPAACYRAGLHNHPALVAEKAKYRNPASFAAGLTQIAKNIGVSPDDRRADGMLPDRSEWTDVQRFEWGRRLDILIRNQILGGEESLKTMQHYVRPFDLPETLYEKPAVIFLLHFGSIHLALAKLIAAQLPFRHVTNSVPLGITFPKQIIDLTAIPANSLLTHMALALRRGSCVTAAIDGPAGQRAGGFRHLCTDYSIAAGPLFLAQNAKVRTHLFIAGHEADKMGYRWVEGPVETASFDELRDFWVAAVKDEVTRLTGFGPENYVQHANSALKAMTVVPYRAKA